MNLLKTAVPSAIALVLASCANQGNEYGGGSAYGPADGGSSGYQSSEAMQTYDTPAAYEDGGTAPAPPPIDYQTTPINPPAHPNVPSAPSVPAASGPVTLHTVVKGDTLSGISKKYKVSIASIKAANNMTKDTVVLGSKIKIPAN